MQYRRTYIPGGCYFFTVVTHNRQHLFNNDETIEILRNAFRNVRSKHPFEINAIVILPDHIHCIWTLPPDDTNFSTRWRLIKTWFTKHSPEQTDQPIWQNRYWEHVIRDEEDYRHHVDYIHYNPVKHGYVTQPFDWLYSSFHDYVKEGILPENWGASEIVLPTDIGKE